MSQRADTPAATDAEDAASQARRLLDRPLPPDYRAAWTRHFAQPRVEAQPAGEMQRVLIFRLGAEWLALPAALVSEITEPRRGHALPHRRDLLVRGIVNVRGELLVEVSLADLLGISAEEPAPTRGTAFARLVVIGQGERRVAFAASEVHGLHRHGSGDTALPATLERAPGRFTRAVIEWQGHAVGLIDEAALTAALDRGLA